MTKLLSVSDLRVGFVGDKGAVELLRGVDIDVGAGEIVAIVGESGSGKSLTALSIMGLLAAPLRVLGGRAIFDGVNLTDLAEDEMHRLRGNQIGMIFQDPLTALNPTLTVGTQLIDVLRCRQGCGKAEAYEQAIEALRAVGINSPEQRMRAYPHQMSGGMRQRILIAMVVQGRPKLIIADEPTTALDVTIQARIIALLLSIRESTNVSLIFISHNLDLVADFCDRVVVLYGGSVMEHGTTVQIISGARHPYTKALLECIPRLDGERGALRVIPGQSPRDPNSMAGCPFAERCSRATPICRSTFPQATEGAGNHVFYCWNPEPAEARAA